MKNIIKTFLIAVSFFTISCDLSREPYGNVSFELDSSGVDLGLKTLTEVRIGSSGQLNTNNFVGMNGAPGELTQISFTHLDGAYLPGKEFTEEDPIQVQFLHNENFNVNSNSETITCERIISLTLIYSEVKNKIVKGNFYLKITAEADPNLVYTLNKGSFEFSDENGEF